MLYWVGVDREVLVDGRPVAAWRRPTRAEGRPPGYPARSGRWPLSGRCMSSPQRRPRRFPTRSQLGGMKSGEASSGPDEAGVGEGEFKGAVGEQFAQSGRCCAARHSRTRVGRRRSVSAWSSSHEAQRWMLVIEPALGAEEVVGQDLGPQRRARRSRWARGRAVGPTWPGTSR